MTESKAVATRDDIRSEGDPSRESAAHVDDSSTDKRRLIDVFIDHLKAASVEVVFGVPGGLLHPFFDAVEQDSDLSIIVNKHEEGSAFMADGYARASGKLAMCAGTSGPGATNLLTGVGVAFSDNVPVLVLTGQAASLTIGRGAVQETGAQDIDLVKMFEPVTKYSAMVEQPELLLHHLRRALRLALTGRPGPVHLNVPVDFWKRMVTVEPLDMRRRIVESTAYDPQGAMRAAQALADARRPVILAGGGVHMARASQELIELAGLIGARVATTPRGKGGFPEDHPQSIGVFGYAGHQEARDTLLGDGVDVLLVVGSSLNETATLCWRPELAPSQTMIHLDVDPERIGRNYPVDIALLGDARVVLSAISDQVRAQSKSHPVCSDWPDRQVPVARTLHSRIDRANNVDDSEESMVTPQQWRAELQEVLPHNALIYSDVGGHMLFNVHELRIAREQDFVLNLGFGSMGHGTVAAMGAALADLARPVVAIVGDACFAMNGMELLTAVEYDIPVVWIVENNQMHGISWHASKALAGRPLQAIRNKRPVDIAAIAEAMGIQTHRVDRPGQLGEFVREALQEPRRPTLIDVRVDPMISPPIGGRTNALEAGNDG